ncbi:MAG: hypothetical protein NT007_12295 [Candidatus Kapabacteria bacterium]|nr:hypothetical protein [Candidatus Kapabacteria bacterium]
MLTEEQRKRIQASEKNYSFADKMQGGMKEPEGKLLTMQEMMIKSDYSFADKMQSSIPITDPKTLGISLKEYFEIINQSDYSFAKKMQSGVDSDGKKYSAEELYSSLSEEQKKLIKIVNS